MESCPIFKLNCLRCQYLFSSVAGENLTLLVPSQVRWRPFLADSIAGGDLILVATSKVKTLACWLRHRWRPLPCWLRHRWRPYLVGSVAGVDLGLWALSQVETLPCWLCRRWRPYLVGSVAGGADLAMKVPSQMQTLSSSLTVWDFTLLAPSQKDNHPSGHCRRCWPYLVGSVAGGGQSGNVLWIL